MIGTIAGFAVFMILLLVAVQMIFDLYARSAVTAATFDAARSVAGFDVSSRPPLDIERSEASAEDRARRLLGSYGRAATFTWSVTPDEVALRVRVTSPSVLPAGLSRPLGVDSIDRTVRVRAEHVVCSPDQRCSTQPTTAPRNASGASDPGLSPLVAG